MSKNFIVVHWKLEIGYWNFFCYIPAELISPMNASSVSGVIA